LTMPKTIISVDFDGVLHSYASGWQGPREARDPPFPGAMEWLRDMLAMGYRLEIFSSRSSMEGGIPTMIDWVNRHAKLITGRNDWTPELIYPTVKPPAKVILDDRAMYFTGKWPTPAEIDAFQPWYKKDAQR